MAATFGLDFGTTNSVATVIGPDPETERVGPRVLTQDGKPHPSVVWYSAGAPVVGCQAKDQLNELGLGVFGDIVRSPKMFLGSPTGSADLTAQQRKERMYYERCCLCHRNSFQIEEEGCDYCFKNGHGTLSEAQARQRRKERFTSEAEQF